MGSARGPGRGVAGGKDFSYVHYKFCSQATVAEEPSWMSEGEVRVLTSRIQEPRTWGKPRSVAGGRSRNDWGRGDCPGVGPGRSQPEPQRKAESPGEIPASGAVLEETARSGESRAA